MTAVVFGATSKTLKANGAYPRPMPLYKSYMFVEIRDPPEMALAFLLVPRANVKRVP